MMLAHSAGCMPTTQSGSPWAAKGTGVASQLKAHSRRSTRTGLARRLFARPMLWFVTSTLGMRSSCSGGKSLVQEEAGATPARWQHTPRGRQAGWTLDHRCRTGCRSPDARGDPCARSVLSTAQLCTCRRSGPRGSHSGAVTRSAPSESLPTPLRDESRIDAAEWIALDVSRICTRVLTRAGRTALRELVATPGPRLAQARLDREALSRAPVYFDELGWEAGIRAHLTRPLGESNAPEDVRAAHEGAKRLKWLGGRDSNPDNLVQSQVSYR